MRHFSVVTTVLASALFLSACTQKNADETVERAFQDVNAIDENNLGEVMLTVGDPNEGAIYFQRAIKENPDEIDNYRGLATSLIRAKRYDEGAAAWERTVALPDATDADRVELADALIRSGNWDRAEKTLTAIPPTHETFKRYRLEAIVADSKQQWKKADSFYQTAVGLTTKPAPVLNNWGYSKLTRGDFKDAERLFTQAVAQDGALFTAKNNLVLARGAQRNYALPVVPMDQMERAQLLHTMALSAIKQGDVETGKGLLRDAIDTHPQHFEAAARSLAALEA